MKHLVKNLARSGYRALRAKLLQQLIPKSHAALPRQKKPVIEVIGFFQSISGIGESARLCAQQLAADGYEVKCTSVENYFRKPVEVSWNWPTARSERKVDCRIYHLNPPMLPTVILQMGLTSFKQTYNIGYWAWELEIIPNEWIKAIRYMNAIFTPSEFTSGVIQRYTNIPVITVTHPVTRGEFSPGMRSTLGIPDDAFLVSNIFSFGSAMERKNPIGLIKAFTSAFNSEDNAYLVLKANAGNESLEKKQLLDLISANPNIRLIDQHWTRRDILGLIQCSSVYASLHRSEGFGLTIAEAMLLDTPTLVTAWSGNMDFCTEENSFLIPFSQVGVNSNHPEFKGLAHAQWADADVATTAKLFKKLYLQPELVAEKKACCARQMQHCIDTHKYQHALEKLVKQEAVAEPVRTPNPIRP
jgi:hypothetical protein